MAATAATDRPNRLVRDDNISRIAGISESQSDLPANVAFRAPPLAFHIVFADAHDRGHSGFGHCSNFGGDDLIGFAEVLPSFGMANDDVANEAAQHVDRYFSRVRAAWVLIHVLRTEKNGRLVHDSIYGD